MSVWKTRRCVGKSNWAINISQTNINIVRVRLVWIEYTISANRRQILAVTLFANDWLSKILIWFSYLTYKSSINIWSIYQYFKIIELYIDNRGDITREWMRDRRRLRWPHVAGGRAGAGRLDLQPPFAITYFNAIFAILFLKRFKFLLEKVIVLQATLIFE
jgi:hypothetical protein